MTDQQQFEDLMARNGVTVRKLKPDWDHPDLVALEIEHGDKVDTMGHCFCEFRFNADGSLAQISFGY